MVLVDTSVWIAHFRQASPVLVRLLEEGRVATHLYVIGELACGHLHNRDEIIRLLTTLHPCDVASHDEVLALIDRWKLMGTGLGYVDVHLLASALIGRTRLWTLDRRLKHAALRLDIVHEG